MATLFVVACSPSKPTPPPNTGGGVVPLTATAVNINEDLAVFVPMLNNPFPLVAHGGTPPYTYTHTGTLPAGLSYSESTGEVSGTPNTAGGPVTIVFSVRDAVGAVASTTATVVYTVHPAPTFTISGKITGRVQAGVLMTLSPSGKTATTALDGTYSFTGVTSGTYTATPTLLGTTFTPASKQVTVNGASVTGVNFTTPVSELKVGKLLYPCPMAICAKDLSTGEETVLWGGFQCGVGGGCANMHPDSVSLSRVGGKVALQGSNLDGIHLLSLLDLSQRQVIFGQINLTDNAGDNCSAWAEQFDLSQMGDFVTISSRCFPVGFSEKRDIFLVKTDGTMANVRVTNDTAFDTSPVVCSSGTVAGPLIEVCFVRNGTEIRKQVVNVVNDTLVGEQTIVASNVMDGVRAMSASPDYSRLVFMKNVGGVPHITVKPLAGGVEIDLGPGVNPHWSLDGSDLIVFTGAGNINPNTRVLWAVKPDGTGKVSVPMPSNILTVPDGAGQVVFLP